MKKYLFRFRLRSTGGIWDFWVDQNNEPAPLSYDEASKLEEGFWDQGYETQIIAEGHEELNK